jgi:aryl-phospho-beta-D-glucosidase BglC (GH1 family)
MFDMGFNTIRLPFSGEFRFLDKVPQTGSFRQDLNPEFVGKTVLEIFDLIIEYAGSRGMYVVLDHHRRSAGVGADGSPVDNFGYNLATWISTWQVMATRYKDNLTVIGADIHNEPHDLTWNVWAGYAEACGNAIHAIAPDWLIFVEGVGSYNGENYWWGGQLKGVRNRPVVLTTPNRLVYSPHEYGQSVGFQTWLAYDNQQAPANWPNNLYGVWDNAWGFIFKENIAPIWIGEFGGHFGINGQGVQEKPHGVPEKTWVNNLIRYLNGYATGAASQPSLNAADVGMSFAYWSLNPNSGDTGGLLRDDWVTKQTEKLDIIKPLVPLTPMYTRGNQILDAANRPFRVKSITWYGAAGTSHVPEGLMTRSFKSIIDQIATLGFNTIRIPFGGAFSSSTLAATSVNTSLNPELAGLNAWQVMDKIIQYAATKNLFVILNYNNASDGGNPDGGPAAGAGVTNWQSVWLMMAARYESQSNVIGADLYTEPVNYNWTNWAALAEQCGNAIHTVAPNWLIFVEGVRGAGSDQYSDGGNLKGVATRPIVLSRSQRVVYSPHDFGQTINQFSWLQRPGNVVANYPNNLYSIFSQNWGYIYEQGIAPVVVGEFGAAFGVNADGVSATPWSTFKDDEIAWFDALVKYMNGYFDGSSTRFIPEGRPGIGWSYFCLNPNATYPLGLVKINWIDAHAVKLTHLDPLINDGENFVPSYP